MGAFSLIKDKRIVHSHHKSESTQCSRSKPCITTFKFNHTSSPVDSMFSNMPRNADASSSAWVAEPVQSDEILVLTRVDSTDTNATEDDLPGPGRALDNLYQSTGRRLENLLNNLAGGMARSSNYDPGVALLSRADTISSDMTMDDLPGPGRALGKIYQISGRRLEVILGGLADKMGYGPAAAERELLKAGDILRYHGYVKHRSGRNEWKHSTDIRKTKAARDTERYCKLVAKYLKSPTPTTQLRALLALVQIQLKNRTSVDNLLKQHDVVEAVRSVHACAQFLHSQHNSERLELWRMFYDSAFDADRLDCLLSTSRKALFCVEENHLNRSAKMLLAMEERFPSPSDAPIAQWEAAFQTFHPFVLHPDLSLLAISYLDREPSRILPMTRRLPEGIYLETCVEMLQNLCALCPPVDADYLTNDDFCQFYPSVVASAFRFLPRSKRWIRENVELLCNGRTSLDSQQHIQIQVDIPQLSHAINWTLMVLQLGIATHLVKKSNSPARRLKKRLEEVLKGDYGELGIEDDSRILHLYRDIEISAAYIYDLNEAEKCFRKGFKCEECTDGHVEILFRKHREQSLAAGHIREEHIVKRFHEETD